MARLWTVRAPKPARLSVIDLTLSEQIWILAEREGMTRDEVRRRLRVSEHRMTTGNGNLSFWLKALTPLERAGTIAHRAGVKFKVDRRTLRRPAAQAELLQKFYVR